MTAGVASAAVLLAVVAVIVGAWASAFAMVGIGLAIAGAAWGLIALARALAVSMRARWAVAVLEILVCLPGGVAMILVADAAQTRAGSAANPGTDGPIADGGVGAIGLAGYAYAGGSIVIVTALACVFGGRVLRLRGADRPR